MRVIPNTNVDLNLSYFNLSLKNKTLNYLMLKIKSAIFKTSLFEKKHRFILITIKL